MRTTIRGARSEFVRRYDAGGSRPPNPRTRTSLTFDAMYKRPSESHPDRLLILTLGFLGLPYIIFFWGWLRPIYAAGATLTLVACCALAARRLRSVAGTVDTSTTEGRGKLGRNALVAALCSVWVLLAGPGGFGYQSSDYVIHNGRLQDLVGFDWPVIYTGSGALVYYVGYYLPCALLGKLAGLALASRAMYAWALSGVLLTAFWIVRLSGGRRIWPVALFVLFGGLSVVGGPLLGWDPRLDSWEWWSIRDVYLARQSMTFQLFWAPHQVIPAWLLCLMLYWSTVVRREPGSAVFLVSLGCLWTPFATIGLLPFLLASALSFARNRVREWFSTENVVGAGLLVTLFGVYYLGGSTTGNPHAWLWQKVPLGDWHKLARLAAFYVLEFGLPIAFIAGRWRAFNRARRLWFAAMTLTLLVAPLYVYGLWNDLHTRGIVPSLVVLFLFAVDALSGASWHDVLRLRRPALAGLALILAIGAATPLPWFAASVREFGRIQEAKSVPDYLLGHQFLGPVDSFFFRHLARFPVERGRHKRRRQLESPVGRTALTSSECRARL